MSKKELQTACRKSESYVMIGQRELNSVEKKQVLSENPEANLDTYVVTHKPSSFNFRNSNQAKIMLEGLQEAMNAVKEEFILHQADEIKEARIKQAAEKNKKKTPTKKPAKKK